MVLTKSELRRIKVKETVRREVSVIVDVHGLRCNQARRLIRNIINVLYVVLDVFEVTVIHGYRRGHALRDMLAEGFISDYVRTRFYDTRNKGVTCLLIAA